MTIIKGTGISAGKAFGRVLVLSTSRASSQEPSGNPTGIYLKAKAKAQAELEAKIASEDPLSKIMGSHLALIQDPDLESEIQDALKTMGAKEAVSTVLNRYENSFRMSENQMLKDRVPDVIDIRERLMRCIDGNTDNALENIEPDTILVSERLLPSQMAMLVKSKVSGIITHDGGLSSHFGILAKSMLIPTVSAIDISCFKTGQRVLVDGSDGKVVVYSEDEVVNQEDIPNHKATGLENQSQAIKNRTGEQEKVEILLNTGMKIPGNIAEEIDGVGLVRTEYLFMQQDDFPSEEKQMIAYGKILDEFSPKPVTFRTLDIGADKSLKYWDLPKEDNPALGNRSLRLCFSNPQVFSTQLRALLRLSVKGNLKIMFPMVGSLEELRMAKAYLNQERDKLLSEGFQIGDYKVGIMIEVPSAAIISDLLAKEVDFASIGTNDLIQFTHAADRGNPEVSEFYQSHSPAVFRLLSFIEKSFKNKDLSVCGQLASDSRAALILIGLGIRKLSVDASAINLIKESIARHSLTEMESLASGVLNSSSQEEIHKLFF